LAIVGAEMKKATKPAATKARSFSVSLPPQMFAEANRAAFDQHLSFSALVRRLLAKELQRKAAR